MADGDALLIVDVQNDFCPGGALPVPEGDRIVPVLNRYLGEFRRRGLPVYASRDWHPRESAHFEAGGGPWPPHCVAGTEGAEFHPALELQGSATVLSAGMGPLDDGYSAFEGTTGDGELFEKELRARGVGRLFIGGLATDYCVRATVLDAASRGFRPVLLTDAVRGIDVRPGDVDRALEEMREAGARTATLDTVTAALDSTAADPRERDAPEPEKE